MLGSDFTLFVIFVQVPILFAETFHTDNGGSYQVFCIGGLLNKAVGRYIHMYIQYIVGSICNSRVKVPDRQYDGRDLVIKSLYLM